MYGLLHGWCMGGGGVVMCWFFLNVVIYYLDVGCGGGVGLLRLTLVIGGVLVW